MRVSYGLTFGAMADDIEVQLQRQGLTLGSKDATHRIQRWADEITNLGIHGLLTGAERDCARKRLIKEIKPLVRSLRVPQAA